MKPPLQLEWSFYDEVSVSALHEYMTRADGDDQELGELAVDLDVMTSRDTENPRHWTAMVEIVVEKKSDSPVPPYELRLEAWGGFSVSDAVTDDEADRLVAVTGGSILYSAAREYISMLTGRSVYGAFDLPTITLQDLQVISVDEGEDEKAEKVTSRRTSKTEGCRR